MWITADNKYAKSNLGLLKVLCHMYTLSNKLSWHVLLSTYNCFELSLDIIVCARPEKLCVKTVCTVLDHALRMQRNGLHIVFIIATGVNAVVVTDVAVAAAVGGERARVLYVCSLLTHWNKVFLVCEYYSRILQVISELGLRLMSHNMYIRETSKQRTPTAGNKKRKRNVQVDIISSQLLAFDQS